MRKILLLIALSGLSLTIKAQQTTGAVDTSKKIFIKSETEPTFPGGINKFYEYISKNSRYHGSDKGRVFVQFVVEKDGSLTNVKVVRGLSENANNELIRLINESPKWIPGTQSNQVVRVMYTVPVNFK